MKVEVAGLKFRIGFKWKIIILVLGILALVVIGLKKRALDPMRDELTKAVIDSGQTILISINDTVGQLLGTDSDLDTKGVQIDLMPLLKLIQDPINRGKITYIYVTDQAGKVVTASKAGLLGNDKLKFQDSVEKKPYKETRRLLPRPEWIPAPDVAVSEVEGARLLDVEQPVYFFGKKFGEAKIKIGLSLDPVYAKITVITRQVAFVIFLILFVSIIAVLILSHILVRPIPLLMKGTENIAKGKFAHRVPLIAHDELGDFTLAFNHMAEGLEQREKIKSALGRVVSKDVYGEMMGDLDNVKVRGEKKHITILFSDVRGFTTHSEKMKPEEVTALLNEYFEEMVSITLKHHGTLDKFIGDGLMALFGAPKSYVHDAVHACLTAIEMRETVIKLNEKWAKEGRTTIAIGVGLNTGNVTAGFIGSTKKMEYSVIGDAVNLASRIEGLNKDFKTTTLISEFTYVEVKDYFDTRELEAVKVKGKEQAVKIYELLTAKPEALALLEKTTATHA